MQLIPLPLIEKKLRLDAPPNFRGKFVACITVQQIVLRRLQRVRKSIFTKETRLYRIPVTAGKVEEILHCWIVNAQFESLYSNGEKRLLMTKLILALAATRNTGFEFAPDSKSSRAQRVKRDAQFFRLLPALLDGIGGPRRVVPGNQFPILRRNPRQAAIQAIQSFFIVCFGKGVLRCYQQLALPLFLLLGLEKNQPRYPTRERVHIGYRLQLEQAFRDAIQRFIRPILRVPTPVISEKKNQFSVKVSKASSGSGSSRSSRRWKASCVMLQRSRAPVFPLTS